MRDGPGCPKNLGRRLSAEVRLGRWKQADHGGSTAIEPVERRPENLDGFVPRISNVTATLELRPEIAGNDDSFAFDSEHFGDLPGLLGVHDYHQIGVARIYLRYRSRAVAREIQTSLGAERNGIRWNGAVAGEKAR